MQRWRPATTRCCRWDVCTSGDICIFGDVLAGWLGAWAAAGLPQMHGMAWRGSPCHVMSCQSAARHAMGVPCHAMPCPLHAAASSFMRKLAHGMHAAPWHATPCSAYTCPHHAMPPPCSAFACPRHAPATPCHAPNHAMPFNLQASCGMAQTLQFTPALSTWLLVTVAGADGDV